MNISFFGAAGTVTGSRHLLEVSDRRILIDCGLFQGGKKLRQRNWEVFPVDPKSIDLVVLTHAHIDHTGYLPVLIKSGFSGQVLCTEATADLLQILLPDSGFLQEKDAEFANRHRYTKHEPALPLYTRADAENALTRLRPVPFGISHGVPGDLEIRFLHAGHILGAAIVEVRTNGKAIVFSGDLGRQNSATMVDPATVRNADYLLVESTYGDRNHDTVDPEDALATVINDTAARGGTVLVPAFAVGRTQSLLFHIHKLKADNRIPGLPVFIDSPMAINASNVFCRHLEDHRLTAPECLATCNVATYVREVEDSKALDHDKMPKIIISASGMVTGGRVVHHLKSLAPNARNTVLLAGFQAAGTRGAALAAGNKSIKIHGQSVRVRAHVETLHMLSAHADSDEIMFWLKSFSSPPKRTFITHGEPNASRALQQRMAAELGWSCHVPRHLEKVALS